MTLIQYCGYMLYMITALHLVAEFIIFWVQVQLLTRVNHKNVVSLIGYCKENGTIALVYEYMSKGNLDERIKGV